MRDHDHDFHSLLCFSDKLCDRPCLVVFERNKQAQVDVIATDSSLGIDSGALRGMLCINGHMRALVPKDKPLAHLLNKPFVQRQFARVGATHLLTSSCDSDALPTTRLAACKICAALNKSHDVRRVGIESGVLAAALQSATRAGYSCSPCSPSCSSTWPTLPTLSSSDSGSAPTEFGKEVIDVDVEERVKELVSEYASAISETCSDDELAEWIFKVAQIGSEIALLRGSIAKALDTWRKAWKYELCKDEGPNVVDLL